MISKPGSSAGKLVVYGAGGHGLVVAETAQLGAWDVLGFLDDRPQALSPDPERWRMLDSSVLDDPAVSIIVAIGANAARQHVAQRLATTRRKLATVIHPSASISASARIGRGVFIGPLAVINPLAVLDDGVTINSGAIVEHHNRIGEYAHIAPRAALGGHVTVGALTLVGIGATVRPGVRIGESSLVGAGAVVCADIPDGATVIGVPARRRG